MSLHFDFILSSDTSPFLRDYEELGHSREVVHLLKSNIVNFICVLFQVQDNGVYPLGLYESPNVINFCVVPFFYGVVLCVELKIMVDGMSASWFPERLLRRGVKSGWYLFVIFSIERHGEDGM